MPDSETRSTAEPVRERLEETSMAAQPIVHIKNVTKNYRMGEITVHALRNMNLEIPTGEFLVLLGPSGSGKTTALNMIGGLDRPSDGAVIVEGEDITT